MKYRFVSDLAAEFVTFISDTSFSHLTRLLNSDSLNSKLLLIPMPLHKTRHRHRGFNQAEVLGKLIAARLQIPIKIDILQRTRETTPQVEMKNKAQRLKNMESVFRVNIQAARQYHDAAVVLFDDVFTTGATMRAAVNVLKRSGVSRVWAVTMAR